jgi:hypothetical protein
MTISVWQRTKAHEVIRCDVAIVGAGISGLSAAIECEAKGLSCAILEASWAGSKASGRNAGFLIRGAAANYARSCEAYGRDRTRALWEWTEENIRGLRALGLESTPGFRSLPSCVGATGEVEMDELVRSRDMMIEDGLGCELVDSSSGIDDALWRSGKVLGGLLNPDDAVCSPYELVRLLGAQLSVTPLFEDAEVYRIEVDGSGCVLHTRGVEVRASRVLLCTNAYAAGLAPSLVDIVSPNRGQMLALRTRNPEDAELQCAYYLNHGSEYIRRGAPGEVLMGGARTYHAAEEATKSDDVTRAVQEHLERFVREWVTTEYVVTARWSGTMGFTRDALPVIGPVDPAEGTGEGRVWFCGGLTGHGMSMGYQTGRHAVRVMVEGEATMFGLDRFGSGAG